METDVELWDARDMEWEDDDFYALLTTEFDEVVIQDYYGDKTGHRTEAFIDTEQGCRQIGNLQEFVRETGSEGDTN